MKRAGSLRSAPAFMRWHRPALLDGREVTTHWRFASDLRRRYPALRIDHKRRLVKDGPFYTSAGLTAGIDLSLALIEEDYGEQLALSVGRDLMMYLARQCGLTKRSNPRDCASQPIDRFGDLIAWIMRNLNQNLTVEVLARQACMCPSHFTRAFKSVFGSAPGEFVENLRLNEARRRLSSRGKTLGSVAASVGFTNASTFRRAFARRFGTGPGACLDGEAMQDLSAAEAEGFCGKLSPAWRFSQLLSLGRERDNAVGLAFKHFQSQDSRPDRA